MEGSGTEAAATFSLTVPTSAKFEFGELASKLRGFLVQCRHTVTGPDALELTALVETCKVRQTV